jgi:hypothetical protein
LIAYVAHQRHQHTRSAFWLGFAGFGLLALPTTKKRSDKTTPSQTPPTPPKQPIQRAEANSQEKRTQIKEKDYSKTIPDADINPLTNTKILKKTVTHPREAMIKELSHASRHRLIGDLQKNRVDEIIMIRIYEEFFNCFIQIVHGHINSYECAFNTHKTTLSYPTLKDDLVKALVTERQVH